MTIRVRYNGRNNTEQWVEKMSGGYWETVRGCPKNTLVTMRDGDRIFFGISRYDARYGHPFTKKMGKKVAQGRAESVKKLLGSSPLPNTLDGVIYVESGMAGCCGVDAILLVLEYFDNIERLAPQGKMLYNAAERTQVLAGVVNAENFPYVEPPQKLVKEKTISANPETCLLHQRRAQRLAGV